MRKDVSHSLRKLRLPKSFPELGPASKLNKMRLASVNQPKIVRFFRPASQRRALIGAGAFFGGFASALRCYCSFCELRNATPFPVNHRSVIERRSIFNPVATFWNYVNYLEKACFATDDPVSWETPALINATKGLNHEVGIPISQLPRKPNVGAYHQPRPP